jgi:sugar lactone lactonase YvrE
MSFSFLAVAVLSILAYLSFTSPLDSQLWVPPSPLPFLEPNTALTHLSERIAADLIGPESLAIQSGYLYTGTMDGRIISLNLETLRHHEVFRFNSSCSPTFATYDAYPPELEPQCGRPLGIRFDPQGRLVVIESYSGVYRLTFTKEGVSSEVLTTTVEGRKITLANDVAITSDGTIYFTESSDRWGRNQIIKEIFATRPVGTLVEMDSLGRIRRVHPGFLPCNGVEISHQEDVVFFVSSPRIYRLDRKTNKVNFCFFICVVFCIPITHLTFRF